jgi:hypothetical protein
MSSSQPSSPAEAPAEPNGVHKQPSDDDDVPDTVEALRAELERVRTEKDELAEQYTTLVGRLNTVRSNVASKLKQDAVRVASYAVLPSLTMEA